MASVKTLVVDDHELFRRGLIALLEGRSGIHVVGEATRGADAIRIAGELQPEVVLMDINMPGMSGIEATQRIKGTAPLARVVVLTVMDNEPQLLGAILAGACGYILKDSPIEQIAEGIKAAARGESLISPPIAARLLAHVRNPSPLIQEDLTAREHEVLDLLVQGLENREIGTALYLSQHTIKNHVSSILIEAARCQPRSGGGESSAEWAQLNRAGWNGKVFDARPSLPHPRFVSGRSQTPGWRVGPVRPR